MLVLFLNDLHIAQALLALTDSHLLWWENVPSSPQVEPWLTFWQLWHLQQSWQLSVLKTILTPMTAAVTIITNCDDHHNFPQAWAAPTRSLRLIQVWTQSSPWWPPLWSAQWWSSPVPTSWRWRTSWLWSHPPHTIKQSRPPQTIRQSHPPQTFRQSHPPHTIRQSENHLLLRQSDNHILLKQSDNHLLLRRGWSTIVLRSTRLSSTAYASDTVARRSS